MKPSNAAMRDADPTLTVEPASQLSWWPNKLPYDCGLTVVLDPQDIIIIIQYHVIHTYIYIHICYLQYLFIYLQCIIRSSIQGLLPNKCQMPCPSRPPKLGRSWRKWGKATGSCEYFLGRSNPPRPQYATAIFTSKLKDVERLSMQER
jgi:hypothetical protein